MAPATPRPPAHGTAAADRGRTYKVPLVAASLVASPPDAGSVLGDRAQRAKLLDAMIELVAEKGYAATTVSDAVRRARVSRGTFYALFASKQACLVAAYERDIDVLERHVADAVHGAPDWLDELRRGLRAYLDALSGDARFARIHLLEWQLLGSARDAATKRFVRRYAKTFARSGRPVPPDEALFALTAGIDQLACARLRAGEDIVNLEDVLVAYAARLIGEETPWT
jgi:AcrR family transcriptional regulator